MPKLSPEFRLLCESCGYDITGLDAGMNCSECGRPVARSVPAARRGSAFQRRRSPLALAATAWRTLRHPNRLFESISIDPGSSRVLLRMYIAIAAVLLSPGPWTDFARVLMHQPLVSWLINLALGALTLRGLTWIEMVGIRTFGARHGWRVTPAVALSICAHAAVGWVITGVLFLVAVIVPLPAFSVTVPPTFGKLSVNIAPAIIPAAGLLVGLICFEVLVYLGVQRCRFANRAEPDSGASRADVRSSPTPA